MAILADSNEELLQDIRRLSTERRLHEDKRSDSLMKRRPFNDATNKACANTTTLDILEDSIEEPLQDIHRLSIKRKTRESGHSRIQKRRPLHDVTNLKVANPTPCLKLQLNMSNMVDTGSDNLISYDKPLARQLFAQAEDHPIKLSSDEEEASLHPTIQAMRRLYYLTDK